MSRRPISGVLDPSRRALMARLLAAGALAAVPAAARAAVPHSGTRRPNILFVMADDLGYADTGVTGARGFSTPALDRIAREGMVLHQGYANSPVCSATRTALLTGRYQYRLRVGLEEPIAADDPQVGVPAGHPTLPSYLKGVGYRTVLIGKWHLGAPPVHSPLNCGYERFYGIHSGGADYFTHAEGVGSGSTKSGLYDGSVGIDDHGYLTELLATRAIREIEEAARDEVPFFLSMHFTAPHWPWEGPEDEELGRAAHARMDFGRGDLATYARMVQSLDANTARLLDTLERLKLASNTIVVFTSDNGGERFSDTWPFVGGKGELLEGGIRVPLFVRWPGHVRAGSSSEQVAISMDLSATLIAAGGAHPDPAFALDGIDLGAQLAGATPVSRELFWRYKANQQFAMRDGDYKYLQIAGRDHLFNVVADPRERANLAHAEPAKLRALQVSYDAWNRQMLPYPLGSYSWGPKGDMVDRY
jgi:arylsulfatase A-like enzyme